MKGFRILPLFLTVLLLVSALCVTASAKPPSTQGVDAVYVMNPEYGQVVFSKDEEMRLYPASTAKLVTALVAEAELGEDLSRKIEITNSMKAAFSGRCLGLSVGERISAESLLYAMLVGGYNDAAIALAFAATGDLQTFCDEMNTYVLNLGLNNTHYTNPTGLHDDAMVTTARDTALIAVEIMKNETLFSITKKQKYIIPATNQSGSRPIYSRNALISTILEEGYYYSYADGIHAGSTDEGGDCVVTCGTYEGQTYVCVVMGGRSDNGKNQAFLVAANALRHALVDFSVKTLALTKRAMTKLPVLYSATVAEVSVYPANDLVALLSNDIDTDKDILLEVSLTEQELKAPLKSGTVVGQLFAKDTTGKLIAKTDLVITEDVEAHGFLLFMAKLKGFVLSPVFLIILILIVALILGSIYYEKRHGRRAFYRRYRRR